MSVFRPNAALAASDVKRLGADLGSVKQNGLGWCPAFGQDGLARHRGLCLQVVEYLLDDGRVFDCGDDLRHSAALAAGFDVDVEHPLQALGPRHGRVAFGRCSVAGGVGLGLASLAAPGRCDPCAVLAVRGKDAVESCQVHARLGHQGRQPGDEVQRLEDDVGGTVAIRGLELILHLTMRGERQAFFGNGGPRNVTAQPTVNRYLRGFEHEVEMVVEQAVGVKNPVVTKKRSSLTTEKALIPLFPPAGHLSIHPHI